MTVKEKKLFKHGGSYALDLPKEFVQAKSGEEVIIQYDHYQLTVSFKDSLESIESEPEFKMFVKALVEDSMKHPEKLKDLHQVWDQEWDELLKDVSAEDDE